PALLLMMGITVEAPDVFIGWTAAQVADAAAEAARRALVGAIVMQGLLFAATLVLTSLPPVRRALTPRGLKRERVRDRAREQFLAKNLHATRHRTGVLIYVSFRERMAELVADEAIHAAVGEEAWTKAMALLTDGLKRGTPAAGFAAAIGQCADVLAAAFPAGAGDNPNELPDAVVMLHRM